MSQTARTKAAPPSNDASALHEFDLSELVAQVQNSPEYAEISAREDAAQLVFEAMQHREMSRAELARCLGKNRSYVTKLLSGEENLSVGNLENILRKLGCRLRLEYDVLATTEGVWLPPKSVSPPLKCLTGGGANLSWRRVKPTRIELVSGEAELFPL